MARQSTRETACPHCGACLRVNEKQLREGRGLARCGRCGKAFDALRQMLLARGLRLVRKDSGRPVAALKAPEQAASGAGRTLTDLQLVVPPPPQAEPGDGAAAASVSKLQTEIEATLVETTPGAGSKAGSRASSHAPGTAGDRRHAAEGAPRKFPGATATARETEIPAALMRELEAAPASRQRGWTVLCGVLLLALPMQITWFNRNLLPEHFMGASFWLRNLCEKLHCRPVREDFMHKVRLVRRDVRSHPARNDILLVNASFRNDAPGMIRYPTLRLVLYDRDGRPAAVHERTPAQYLGNQIRERAGLRSGHPTHVLLELPAPQQEILRYEFFLL